MTSEHFITIYGLHPDQEQDKVLIVESASSPISSMHQLAFQQPELGVESNENKVRKRSNANNASSSKENIKSGLEDWIIKVIK